MAHVPPISGQAQPVILEDVFGNPYGGAPASFYEGWATGAGVAANSGAPAKLFTVNVVNATASALWLVLTDTAAAPGATPTGITQVVYVPANTAAQPAPITFPMGLPFANGLSFGLYTSFTNAALTFAGANAAYAVLGYT